MGRFKDDFPKAVKGLGLKNAVDLVLVPRVFMKLGIKGYQDSQIYDRFIHRKLGDVASRFKDLSLPQNAGPILPVIWVFWWQGEAAMPPVVKECFRSVERNANGRQIVLLHQGNYEDYVNLPTHIVSKFKDGKIQFPHFSDVLRVALLAKYGGLWLDAAIFVTKPIPFCQGLFYSPKLSLQPDDSPHMSQWCMGVMESPAGMPLFAYLYDMLAAYWTRFDSVFSYLMFDWFIRYGYEHFPWVKELMDNRKIESPDIHASRYLFAEEVEETHLEELLERNTFLSLTYRIKYPLQAENGKDTYYSALLKKYNNGKDQEMWGRL